MKYLHQNDLYSKTKSRLNAVIFRFSLTCDMKNLQVQVTTVENFTRPLKNLKAHGVKECNNIGMYSHVEPKCNRNLREA